MTGNPRSVPTTASVAATPDGGKLHAPAAARNTDPLCALLLEHAPRRGRALELASGTGQHVVAFARALPALHWQPTDLDAARLSSIDTYAAEAGLANIAPAVALNATRPGPCDLILLVNLLHLISTPEAETLITEAAGALAADGTLIIYGPFKRDGRLISAGDTRFDASLRAHDPQIGYKDDGAVLALAQTAGLSLRHTVEMPANNLALLWQRPAAD